MERKRENGTLVRTDLTDDEYRQIRKQAIDKGVSTKKHAGDALRRALLKGAKP